MTNSLQTNRWIALPLTLSFVAIASCESVTSIDKRTSAIYADIYIEGDNVSVATVRVRLLSGGEKSNTTIDLSDSTDYLNVTALGETQKLTLDTNFGDSRYVASITNAALATTETQFIVDFQRVNDESAPNSTVKLPKAFVATVGTSSSATDTTLNVKFAEELVITATKPTLGTFQYEINGSCIYPLKGDLGASSTKISKTSFFQNGSETACPITIDIINENTGTVDLYFRDHSGGAIRAAQKLRLNNFSIQF